MSESTIDKHLKVKSMPSLCFNKDDFVSNEFSVDKFVSECRKCASLDTMHDDLNIFHKILCTAMLELLNKDYADFLNLSSNLAGLDKSIKSLTLPLQSLKNEIKQTKANLDSTLLSVMKMFSERISVHCSKILIHHILNIEEGLEEIKLFEDNHKFKDMQILERMAIALNNLQFHMHKVIDCKNYSVKEEVLSSLARNLEQQLQAVFLQSLSDENRKQDLHKILRMYSYISEEYKVEEFFRTSVVHPVMKNLITQNNITKLGMQKVLNDILSFIPNSCDVILKMTRRANNDSEIVLGYDFLVNAVWPEIIDAFQYVAPAYLYSLGHPQQFHQNYSLFMIFLDEFENFCCVQSSVSRLREQTTYKEFIQKFNLDVYFQIRFQEIAGTFEYSLIEERLTKKEIETNEANSPYSLKATESLWSCINLCWSDSIYISFLKKDFWKLTVQLIFRYNRYIQCCFKNIKEEASELFSLALLIKDIETLVPNLQTFFLETIKRIMLSESLSFQDTVKAAVEEIVFFLNEIPTFAAKLIVRILVEKCTSHLKLISSIPQRFRKTNREIPSKPSPYVSIVLTPLTEFSLCTKSIIPSKWRTYCELQVTDEIMKQCVNLMQDVFTSIKKMEQSLKILKRARDKPTQNTGQFSTGAVTDDDKIRRQLAIDVTYFEELILKSGLQVSDLKSFKELKDLVTSAERVSGFSSS